MELPEQGVQVPPRRLRPLPRTRGVESDARYLSFDPVISIRLGPSLMRPYWRWPVSQGVLLLRVYRFALENINKTKTEAEITGTDEKRKKNRTEMQTTKQEV